MNSLACLRNAGSHSAVTYCSAKRGWPRGASGPGSCTGRILERTLVYIEVPRSATNGMGEFEVTVNAELTRTVIYTATAQEEMLRSKTPSAKHRILASKAQCRIEYKRSAGTESSNHATTQSTHNHPALSIVYLRSSFCEIS